MRGQAFETMMLVISVIVAIAILGILLGFLGQITIIGAEAGQVIPDMVKKVYNKGYGVEVKDRVDFKAGSVLVAKDLTGNIFPEDQIYVFCAGEAEAICDDSDAPIEISDEKRIIVHNGGKASVAVCKGDEKIQYLVTIGIEGRQEETRDACMTEAGL